jgi:hypothetical protein
MQTGFIEAGQPKFDDWDTVAALSYSVAKTLLNATPLRAWQQHRLLGGKGVPKEEPTEAKARGIVIDSLLIGAAEHRVVVVDFEDFRTKEARRLRDEAYAADKVPIIKAKFDEYKRIIDENLKPKLGNIFGKPRVKAAWMSGGVYAHAEFDGLNENGVGHELLIEGLAPDAPLVVDLKSCTDCVDASRDANLYNYDYQLQNAAYLDACSIIRPDLAPRLQFLLVFAEVVPPYDVRFVQLERSFVEMGQGQWARACRIWDECMCSNQWPGSGRKVYRVSAPLWAVRKEQSLLVEHGGALLANVPAAAEHV